MEPGVIALITSAIGGLATSVATLAGMLYRQKLKESEEWEKEAKRRGKLIIWYATGGRSEEDHQEFIREARRIFDAEESR